MGDADQAPLRLDLGNAPQQELPEAASLFDLPDCRLDDLFPEPVPAPVPGSFELRPHVQHQRPGRLAPMRPRRLLAVLQSPDRDVTLHPAALELTEVLL